MTKELALLVIGTLRTANQFLHSDEFEAALNFGRAEGVAHADFFHAFGRLPNEEEAQALHNDLTSLAAKLAAVETEVDVEEIVKDLNLKAREEK